MNAKPSLVGVQELREDELQKIRGGASNPDPLGGYIKTPILVGSSVEQDSTVVGIKTIKFSYL